MTNEELIKILEKYPKDSKVFVSNLCMGWIDDESIEYDSGLNAVKFI